MPHFEVNLPKGNEQALQKILRILEDIPGASIAIDEDGGSTKRLDLATFLAEYSLEVTRIMEPEDEEAERRLFYGCNRLVEDLTLATPYVINDGLVQPQIPLEQKTADIFRQNLTGLFLQCTSVNPLFIDRVDVTRSPWPDKVMSPRHGMTVMAKYGFKSGLPGGYPRNFTAISKELGWKGTRGLTDSTRFSRQAMVYMMMRRTELFS